MNRSTVRMVPILFVGMSVVACSGDGAQEEKEQQQQVVSGFDGGCKDGTILYVQNQFTPLGAQARDDVDVPGAGPTVNANKRLVATGWLDTGEQLYPDNPSGIRGEVWYFIPKLKAWVADAAVRGVETSPAPNDASRFFTKEQAAPMPDECRLSRSD